MHRDLCKVGDRKRELKVKEVGHQLSRFQHSLVVSQLQVGPAERIDAGIVFGHYCEVCLRFANRASRIDVPFKVMC